MNRNTILKTRISHLNYNTRNNYQANNYKSRSKPTIDKFNIKQINKSHKQYHKRIHKRKQQYHGHNIDYFCKDILNGIIHVKELLKIITFKKWQIYNHSFMLYIFELTKSHNYILTTPLTIKTSKPNQYIMDYKNKQVYVKSLQNLNIMELLNALQIDPNITGEETMLLEYVCGEYYGHDIYKVIDYLVSSNIKLLNSTNIFDKTPINYVFDREFGDHMFEMVYYLIKFGTVINANILFSLFHTNCDKFIIILNYLFNKGIVVNDINLLLHKVVTYGFIERDPYIGDHYRTIISYLIKMGADINYTCGGNNLLHLVTNEIRTISAINPDIYNILFSYNLDPHSTDANGNTIYQLLLVKIFHIIQRSYFDKFDDNKLDEIIGILKIFMANDINLNKRIYDKGILNLLLYAAQFPISYFQLKLYHFFLSNGCNDSIRLNYEILEKTFNKKLVDVYIDIYNIFCAKFLTPYIFGFSYSCYELTDIVIHVLNKNGLVERKYELLDELDKKEYYVDIKPLILYVKEYDRVAELIKKSLYIKPVIYILRYRKQICTFYMILKELGYNRPTQRVLKQVISRCIYN